VHGEDIEELKKRCTQLGVDDNSNAVIAKEMGDAIKDIVTHNYNKAEATQTGNEKKQQQHHKMLREHSSLHDKEKEAISELKLNLTTLMD
jgi:ATP-dependent Zn protease